MSIEFCYDVHGIGVSCDFPLPELTGSQGADFSAVKIVRAESLPLPLSGGEFARVDSAGFHIAWGKVGAFHVTSTGQIYYRRFPGASDALIRVPLLGSVLAVALHYLGKLVLHGNAISVGGDGIILAGAKGQGKSTLSAALVARGHAVHADDAVSVAVGPDSRAEVFRGTRGLRLWPDAIGSAFGGVSPSSRPIHELSEKRVVPLDDQSVTPARLPLARIYVLEDADDIGLQPLGVTEAWPLVLAHALVSRFGTELLRGRDAARHFAACAALARSVRCVRLRRPRDFARLAEVAARIEQDLLCA